MKLRVRLILGLCCLLTLGSAMGAAGAETLPVHVVQVSGTIDQGISAYLCRAISDAERDNAVLLIEITTLGGRVDAALETKDCLLASSVKTFSYVKGRALSAGALIALAAAKIAMAPGSSIGAAEPRPNDAKTVSAVRTEFEATATQRGRNPEIAAAMVDSQVTIPNLVEQGRLLTLYSEKASQVGFADAIAANRSEVLDAFLPGVQTETKDIPLQRAERLTRLVTDPYVSSLLLTVGFLGLLIEVITPGFGIPGALGVLAISLFFGGRLVAGVVGWLVAAVFFAGLVLVFIEVLVPGFGVPGVLGLLAIGTSLFLSFDTPSAAFTSLAITTVATVVLGGLAIRSFGRENSRLRGIILATRQSNDEGYVPTQRDAGILGKEAVTLTAFRPSGAIDLDGDRIDAVSEGPMIPAGVKVRIVKVEGWRVVVRTLD